MPKRLALSLATLLALSTSYVAAQEIIPPRTLTKKRIVIQNIHKCREERSVLVGRGEWNQKAKKWTKYVCRASVVQVPPDRDPQRK